MKAVVCYGNHVLKIKEIPRPKVKPGHVLIHVKATGICGTDHAIFAGHGPPWTRYPIVPGHEYSGVVAEVGQGVASVQVGDAVVVDNYLRCGGCWYCKNGYYFLCDNHTEVGMTINGGFAEYSLLPETNVVRIPKTLSVVDAVLTEPVATALRACRGAGIRFNDKVVVLGCGPLGILIAQISKLMGAQVILVGRGERLKRVEKMSFDAVINFFSSGQGMAQVQEKAGSAGVDVVFDVTGSEELIYASVELLKRMGRLILLGITWGKKAEIPPDAIVLKEIQILGKVSGMGFFEEAIGLLSERKINPVLNLTHTFPLDQYQQAIRYEKERIEGAIKVAIVQ